MAQWLRADDHGSYAARLKDPLAFGYPKFGTTDINGILL
jgi:hypothetical protein